MKYLIFIIVIACLFFSCNNNDDIILKEIENQNAFLDSQYRMSKEAFYIKEFKSRAIVPYIKAFKIQDSLFKLFQNKLITLNEDSLDAEYELFVKHTNSYLDRLQSNLLTKLLTDDYNSIKFSKDTLPDFKNVKIKKQLIVKSLIQKHIMFVQLYTCCSSGCNLGIVYNSDKFGYRLIINNDSTTTVLNLKLYDIKKSPHFKKLEFTSFCILKKGEYYYQDEAINNSKSVIANYNKEDAIIIKTKVLAKGWYRINCNKLEISEEGRLVKAPTYFDFEIE